MLTVRTITDATFFVAGMLPTVADPLTLDVAGELPGALHLLLLGAAPAGLRYHLEAGRTVSSVKSEMDIID